MQKILTLRARKAALLGFKDYVHLSLATKMAESAEAIHTFLTDLAHRSQPFAQKDWQQLTSFARIDDFQVWDMPFYSRQLQKHLFDYSELEVKAYFPYPHVLNGLFAFIKNMFGLTCRQAPHQETWHSDVAFYELIDENNHIIGGFYCDPYAREGKQGGAWMDEVLAGGYFKKELQRPVAHLICNFTPPTMTGESHNVEPSCLTHDEVITLLHEMGHVLHHVLSQVKVIGLSGTRYVEWDAVELPSQWMENFAWDETILRSFSSHVKTGEPLPSSLFQKMRSARFFQSGLMTLRQIEFALFDLRVHSAKTTEEAENIDIMQVLHQVRDEVAVVKPPYFNRFAHQFSHIFQGSYAAGYYSYKWAEVLSCDAYAYFEENLNKTPQAPSLIQETLKRCGHEFWREVLAVGGTRPAMESFKAFRHRPPQITALLRMSGLIDSQENATTDAISILDKPDIVFSAAHP